jgi:hypothetical protein
MSCNPHRIGTRRTTCWLLWAATCVALPSVPIAASTAPNASALVVGRQVKVEGHQRSDGTFEALQIVLRDVDRTVKIEGRIASVRPGKKGFTVLGFEVVLSAATALYRGSALGASRAELTPNAWVEVKGTRRGQTLAASRVRIKDAAEPTEELEAIIEGVGTAQPWLVVLGRRVIWSPDSTVIIDERRGGDPEAARLRRDDDDQSREPWRIGSRVLAGGRLESAWLQEGNFDLDGGADRADRWVSRVQVLASAQLTDSLEAYTKVSIDRSAQLFAGGVPARQDFDVEEAYVQAHRVGGGPINVLVGRQRFRDAREWFFDEYLDAVRATAVLRGWKVDAAVADGVFAGPITARARKERRHVLASAVGPAGARGRAGLFYVARDDRGPGDDDPRWIGSTFEEKFAGGSRVWALAAARRGHRGRNALRGWAMDAGATLVMADRTGTPSITLGYARASGDTVSGDGRDTTFRQTDLEDNSARMGGLRRLAYYGELFDPELSNLQVFTAGAGFRPTRRVGLDVVLHRYLQAALRDSIPSSAFDLDASGASRLLGHELDGAVTVRVGRFDVDVASGVFVAGAALSRQRRLAFFWRPQVRLYF